MIHSSNSLFSAFCLHRENMGVIHFSFLNIYVTGGV